MTSTDPEDPTSPADAERTATAAGHGHDAGVLDGWDDPVTFPDALRVLSDLLAGRLDDR